MDSRLSGWLVKLGGDVLEVSEVGGGAQGLNVGKGLGVVVQMEVVRGSFHGEEVRNIIKKPANCFIFASSDANNSTTLANERISP